MDVVIPSHPEAERAILGICLCYGTESVEETIAFARTEGLFHDERHVELWGRIEKLHRAGSPMDIVLIAKEQIQAVLDLGFISDLANNSVPQANLKQYLAILADYQKRRIVIRAAIDLLASAQREDKKIDEAIEAAEVAMYGLQEVSRDEKTISQGLKKVIDGWEYAHQHPNELTGIPSGLHDLDRLTWGFQKQNLIIIGARPSQGKTALLGTIAEHCAVSLRIPTLIFSLESSMEELLRRLICSRARLNASKLRAGNFNQGEMVSISKTSALLNKSPLYIIDRGALTIGQIRSISRRYVKRHGIKAIMVDYLQKVKPSTKSEKRTYEVGQVSDGLKEMAKELDLPVIAACQLNRESEKEKGRMPRPSDLGDSGMIERDADLIALLYRLPEQTSEEIVDYKLLLGKNRDGDTRAVPLVFHRTSTRFDNARINHD